MPSSRAVIASAGARKTQILADEATNEVSKRCLVTTYTTLNQREIQTRVAKQFDAIPPNRLHFQGWLPFVLEHGVRPYQRSVLGRGAFLDTFNFTDKRLRFASKQKGHRHYWLDGGENIFRDSLAEFAVEANNCTDGAVIKRLERIYDSIFIDEAQDLVGWDLEFLELLLKSSIRILIVGDPRQHTYSTNDATKNKKYRGMGFVKWLRERKAICETDNLNVSYRCNQAICDIADALFPEMEATISANHTVTGHDGVFPVRRRDVHQYVSTHSPVVLRENKRSNTESLRAFNFGQVKGQTFDRVLIFPTKPMLQHWEGSDQLGQIPRAKLYVAYTRARYSVGFVVD